MGCVFHAARLARATVKKPKSCLPQALLDLKVLGGAIRLEEYARTMIAAETAHQDAVNKMLRNPGQMESFVMEGQTL